VGCPPNRLGHRRRWVHLFLLSEQHPHFKFISGCKGCTAVVGVSLRLVPSPEISADGFNLLCICIRPLPVRHPWLRSAKVIAVSQKLYKPNAAAPNVSRPSFIGWLCSDQTIVSVFYICRQCMLSFHSSPIGFFGTTVRSLRNTIHLTLFTHNMQPTILSWKLVCIFGPRIRLLLILRSLRGAYIQNQGQPT
jgi:hypothetical protein